MTTREHHPNTPRITISDEETLEEVSLDPKLSYIYALNFIQEPFPKGELAIARSAKYSFRYAINILGARFKKGEKVIRQSNYKELYKDFFNLTDEDF